MKKRSLISIVCPSYNSGNTLEQTLLSIFNQTYQYWEIIIVDGGSTDNTKEIVLYFQKQGKNIRFEQFLERSGPGPAREYGISLARGDYLAFIDSDDLWVKSKLKLQLSFMLETNILFSYTKYDLIDQKGTRKEGPILWKSYDYHSYFRKRGIANSSVIIKRNLFSENFFDSSYDGFAEDTALWLKLMQSGCSAYLLPKSLLIYRYFPDARSRQVFKNAIAVLYIYKKLFKKSYIQISYLYPLYVLDVILRSRFKKLMLFLKPASFN